MLKNIKKCIGLIVFIITMAMSYPTMAESETTEPVVTPSIIPTEAPKETRVETPRIMTTNPVLVSIASVERGVQIKWNACQNAEKYKVFRKASGERSWRNMGIVTGTVFIDQNVSNGVVYTYTVRCLSNDESYYMSGYNKGLSVRYYSCPFITHIGNTSSGIRLQWKRVNGAGFYAIFRRDNAGKWVRLAITKSTQYDDTKLGLGRVGIYTVRCMDATGKKYLSGCEIKGKSIVRLGQCQIKGLKNAANGVEIAWNKVTGAQGYCIYRKGGEQNSYHMVARVSGNATISYVDSKLLSNGTSYSYAVRAYNGTSLGTYTTKAYHYLVRSVMEEVANSIDNGVSISWKRNTRVSGYMVCYIEGDNVNYLQYSGNTSISQTIKGLQKGKTYRFYVRGYKTISGNTYYSCWSTPLSVKIDRGTTVDLAKLKTSVESITRRWGGNWSVYVKDLNTGAVLSINDTAMYPASVIKLFAMASTYNQIQRGKLSQSAYINSLLREMITVSDNGAFNELIRYHVSNHSFLTGAQVVNQYAKYFGYTSTEVHHTLHPSSDGHASDGRQNKCSAKDAGRLLESIYNGYCVSPAYSAQMLNLLKQQTRTWKIPSGVPAGVTVANKTGETNSYQHDTAIVYGKKTTFILCVFSNTTEYNGCNGIRQIASTVYNYLNS